MAQADHFLLGKNLHDEHRIKMDLEFPMENLKKTPGKHVCLSGNFFRSELFFCHQQIMLQLRGPNVVAFFDLEPALKLPQQHAHTWQG